MPAYPQQLNYSAQKPTMLDFDLQSEKQRIAEETEKIKNDLQEKWNQRYKNAQIFPDSLQETNPELIQLLLLFQNTLLYNDLSRKHSLSQQQRDALPKIIWYVCLSKEWEKLKQYLTDDLKVGLPIADQIMTSLNQAILIKARELSQQNISTQKKSPGFEQKENKADSPLLISIADANKQFPEIGEQLITSEKISLNNYPEPVRPSIKNWLTDYTLTLGYERHNSIQRGNFLFHGKNTEHLSSGDREKLSYILKAYDEQTPVAIGRSTKQIIFPSSKITPPKIIRTEVPTPKPAPLASGDGLSAPDRKFFLPTKSVPTATKPKNNDALRPNFQNFQKSKSVLQDSPQKPQLEALRSDYFHSSGQVSKLKQNPIIPATPSAPKMPAPPTPPQSVAPAQKTFLGSSIKFSSPQKLPYEKNLSAQPQSAPSAQNAKINWKNPIKLTSPDGISKENKIDFSKKIEPAKTESKPVKSGLYTIRPVFSKKEEPNPLSKNILDLRGV